MKKTFLNSVVLGFFVLVSSGVAMAGDAIERGQKSAFLEQFFRGDGKRVDYVLWGFPEDFSASFKEQDTEGFFGEQLSIFDYNQADMLLISLETWKHALLLPMLLQEFEPVFDYVARGLEHTSASIDIVLERDGSQMPVRVFVINIEKSGDAVASTECLAAAVYVSSTTSELFQNRSHSICKP